MIHVFIICIILLLNLFKYCDAWVAPAIAAQAVSLIVGVSRQNFFDVYSVLCLFLSNKTSSSRSVSLN